MPHLSFAIICLLWGSNFILMKKALASLGYISVGAWRVTLGAATVAIIWWLRRQPWPVTRRHLAHLVPVVFFSYLYPFTVQPYLIVKSGSSAFVGMMVVLVPLTTIIVSIPMLGIRPTAMQMFGVLGGLVCSALVFYEAFTVRGLTAIELLLAIGVPIGYAIANTYIRQRLRDVPALPLTLASLVMGAIVLLPLGLAFEPVKQDEHLSTSIVAITIVGTLGTGIATVLFYKLIHDRGPLFAGMVTYVIPVVALIHAAIEGEQLTALQVGALGGIFAMLAVVQLAPQPAAPALGLRLDQSREA